MENFKNNPFVKKVGFNRIVLVGVLILMYIVFSVGSGRMLGFGYHYNSFELCVFPGIFGTGRNLCNWYGWD